MAVPDELVVPTDLGDDPDLRNLLDKCTRPSDGYIIASESKSICIGCANDVRPCTIIPLSDDAAVLQRDFLLSLTSRQSHILRVFAVSKCVVYAEYCHLGSLSRYLRTTRDIGAELPWQDWHDQILAALEHLRAQGLHTTRLDAEMLFVAEDGDSLRFGDFGSLTNIQPSLDTEPEPAPAPSRMIGSLFATLRNSLPPPTSTNAPLCLTPPRSPPKTSDDGVQCNVAEPWTPDERNLVVKSEAPRLTTARSGSVHVGVVKLTKYLNNLTDPGQMLRAEMGFIRAVRPQHPNIVQIFATTEHHIFMEFCLDGSLADYRPPQGHPPPLRAWALDILSALHYLHIRGWSHNEIHAGQVLVCNHARSLKLCDFGSAQLSATARPSFACYAPELLRIIDREPPQEALERGYKPGELTDIYNFGLLLWHCQEWPEGTGVPGNGIWSDRGLVGVVPHSEVIDFTSFDMVDIMKACFDHYTRRPSAAALIALIQADGAEKQT